MPRYACPKCHNKVQDKGKDDGIACDVCRKWFHFSCSDLTKQQFAILCRINDLEWICPTCTEDECSKCEKIFRLDKRIKCSHCNEKYHIRCSGLTSKALEKIVIDQWICVKCSDDIFPFNIVPPKKMDTFAFNSLCPHKHPNKLRNINPKPKKKESVRTPSSKCKVCLKVVKKMNKAIPCPTCEHLIHKTCSALTQSQIINFKRTKNIWECPHCTQEKFPFSGIENDEIQMSAFNSNWKCGCNKKPVKKTGDEDIQQEKLILNYKKDTDSNFTTPGDDFDLQFDTYYALEPKFKYYDTHEFHQLKDKLTNPFSIIHTNICSLQSNGEELYDLVADLEFKFDIIAVTETWNPEEKKHKFTPPIMQGYSPYQGITGSSLKGGCGVYVNTDLSFNPRKELNFKIKTDDCEIETFWIEIILDRQPNRLICVVYRHPNKRDTETTENLQKVLNKIKRENKNTLILGDFNYDLLNHENSEHISKFLHMMIENSFQPCILEPTRIIFGNKPSLVDNIFSNSLEPVISGNLYQKISDHLPNFVIINNSKPQKKKEFVKKRCPKNFDPIEFQNDLLQLILHKIVNFDEFYQAYDYSHKMLLNILNKYFPLKILTKKEIELERKPWITQGILTSTKIKNKTYRLFAKSNDKDKSSSIYIKFKRYRDLINTLKKKSQKLFHVSYFKQYMNNAKKSWAGINTILHRKNKQKNSDIFLNVDGKLVTDQKIVSKLFNNYFVNVADNLAKKYPNQILNFKITSKTQMNTAYIFTRLPQMKLKKL